MIPSAPGASPSNLLPDVLACLTDTEPQDPQRLHNVLAFISEKGWHETVTTVTTWSAAPDTVLHPWRTDSLAEACERLETRGLLPQGFFDRPDASFERFDRCARCKGGGFSGAGSGYDAVCDDCVGQSEWTYPARIPPNYWTLVSWASLGPAAILAVEESARETRRRLAQHVREFAPYRGHVTWRWGEPDAFAVPLGWPATFELVLQGQGDWKPTADAYVQTGATVPRLRATIDAWDRTMTRLGPNPYAPLLAIDDAGSALVDIEGDRSVVLTGRIPREMQSPRARTTRGPWRADWVP